MLLGCGGKARLVGGDQVSVVAASALPAPDAQDAAAELRAARLGPRDKITIDVFGVEGFKREMQIDASGYISYPFVGQVMAAGRTPGELANMIASALRADAIKDPQVTVNLVEQTSQVVTVEGSVQEPGLYPVIGDMTLLRAVASAKGTTDIADSEHAVIFRTVGNRKMAALYSLTAVREGRYADPRIYPGDVVQVGTSAARRTFKDMLQAAPLLVAPLVAVLQNN